MFSTWNLHVYKKDLHFNTKDDSFIKQLYFAFMTF